MWLVKIEDGAAKVFESDGLTDDDRVVVQNWAKTVIKHGPNELKKYPSIWADHALYGKWRDYRSSSFSYSGRIIYRVKGDVITVVVVRITKDHDYKK